MKRCATSTIGGRRNRSRSTHVDIGGICSMYWRMGATDASGIAVLSASISRSDFKTVARQRLNESPTPYLYGSRFHLGRWVLRGPASSQTPILDELRSRSARRRSAPRFAAVGAFGRRNVRLGKSTCLCRSRAGRPADLLHWKGGILLFDHRQHGPQCGKNQRFASDRAQRT